jgi:t-SNARE complex subunit (syntaxin)
MNEQLQDILPKTIQDRWTQYLVQRNRGLKSESKQSLTEVIESLESLGKESLNQFVFYLTDLQRTDKEKIDFNLFEKIVLPCLIEGTLSNLVI